MSNACFFNMGARLARYTSNDTYSKLAEETWDWIQGVGYISDKWDVYDGANIADDCTDINKLQFSYSAAVLVQGAAFMWNIVSFILPPPPQTAVNVWWDHLPESS